MTLTPLAVVCYTSGMNVLAAHRQQIIDTVTNYGVTYLAVFGSHARNEATPDSDIDLLVDYAKPLGLFKFARLQRQLSEILKKNVDLVSRKGVSKHLKPYIMHDAQVVYEKN